MEKEVAFETDVLVIGAGMAGFMAAIKAREHGAEVILVDKGYIGKSGQSPYAMDFVCFDPGRGHDYDRWVDEIVTSGEYLNNREWIDVILNDSLPRLNDIDSYGVEIFKNDDGSLLLNSMGGTLTETAQFAERKFSGVLRKYAKKIGIRLADKTMITDLLTINGCVVGGIGIPTESYDLHIFNAKATILATAGYGFKPLSFPGYELTADGEAMAYRVGAEISGKEFTPVHFMGADPCKWYHFMSGISAMGWDKSGHQFPAVINAEGQRVPLATPVGFRELDFEAHAGRAPLYFESDKGAERIFADWNSVDEGGKIRFTGGGFVGMSVHGSEGIWVQDTQCATTVPGLFAAGDSAATRHMGATYCNWGFAFGGAGIAGSRAGAAAAEFATQSDYPQVDSTLLEEMKQITLAPARRKGGFGPGWVTQALNHMIIPYYILHIKKADRLQAALTLVEFIRDHLVPKLYATDPHELRLAHETRNMVLNAEMKLKASLFRTESRGRHYREDYPNRDDENWLAWVNLKNNGGEMVFEKKPLPSAWHPDHTKSEEEKYPFRFTRD